MVGYSVVAETGIRDDASPLCLHSIQPGMDNTDSHGQFERVFFTEGGGIEPMDNAPVPKLIEIHIQFKPGVWRCREVGLDNATVQVRGHETEIDLGLIEVNYAKCRTPKKG